MPYLLAETGTLHRRRGCGVASRALVKGHLIEADQAKEAIEAGARPCRACDNADPFPDGIVGVLRRDMDARLVDEQRHRVVFMTRQDRMPWRIRCRCGWTTNVRDVPGAEGQRAEAMSRWRAHVAVSEPASESAQTR